MERCPICRATLNGAETCRRRRAELGSVMRTERTAEQLRTMAMHCFMSGDPDTADRLLRRSALLHRTPATLNLQRLVKR